MHDERSELSIEVAQMKVPPPSENVHDQQVWTRSIKRMDPSKGT